jgi:eukaryotic-like serine/threonine-protein kinase
MSAHVPGYVLHELLGRGAETAVWQAEPAGAPGRVVVVKRLEGVVAAGAVTDLRREADALDRLSHPSILRLLDVVEHDGGVALVVPYAPGGSLADRVAALDGGLTPSVVADLGARLGTALAAAHNAGLVHRDVKPANILFDLEGQPLLADFGTARLVGDRPPPAGTAEYLDPEVAAGAPPGVASDVYGLGATLYEALAGTPPYAGSSPQATLRAADRARHVPLHELVTAPAALTEAIEAALARDPARRPSTASELAARLDEARRALEPEQGPPPVPGRLAAPPGPAPAPVAAPTAPTPVAERSGTRPFGPAPPRPSTEPAASRPAVDRRLLLLASVLVVVVPLGVVWWLTRGDPAPPPGAEEPPSAALERSPAPPCDHVAAPTAADGVEVLAADVAGRGCSVPVVWDGEVLVVHRPDREPVRYDLDAEAEDHLLLGDWTCDGRDSPAVYRPTTGELFLFDGFADGDQEVVGSVEDTGSPGGTPRVLVDDDGCDRVEVAPP